MFDLALFVPALVVETGNPLGIETIADLTRPGLRVVICESSAAMGQAAERILGEQGILDQVVPNIINRPATAPQIALNVALGQADAGITGRNSGGELEDKVDFIMIPPEINAPTLITAAVLNSSLNRTDAELFVDFLCSPAGRAIFEKHNYGDASLK
jgi:molybdate transport system substrate-binding protein